jgi:hypothetical protein
MARYYIKPNAMRGRISKAETLHNATESLYIIFGLFFPFVLFENLFYAIALAKMTWQKHEKH